MNIESLLKAALLIATRQPIRGEAIGQDKFNNGKARIFIDTCFTNGTNKYETAIKINDDEIVIVEKYDTPQEAKIGHKNWVNTCKQKSFHFYSVQTGEMYIYEIKGGSLE